MIDIDNNTVYLGGALPDEKGTSNGGLELLDTLENFNLNFISGSITPETWATVYGPSPLLLSKAKANGLGYVKLFGGTEQRNLPSEYTQVEYLESSGTQYIDTGYKLSSADEVKVKAKFISFLTSGSSYVFGIYGDNANFGINNNNAGSYAVWGSASTEFTPTMVRDTIYDVDMKLGLLTINGIAASYTPSGTFTNTTKSAYLFWANGTSQPKQHVAIYSFQIINNGTIIQNLIPAKRKSDNVLGMYDTVTGNFLTNAGTGDFTAGPDAVPTPDTPMDIISNNGVLKYGYQSVNMFDKNSALEDGEIWGPEGRTQPLANYYGTNQIHVIGGHTYTRNGAHGSANYIKLSDGTWTNQSDSSATITMPDNAVLWIFNNTTSTSRDTMMVVEGTSLPAEYVPYKGYGIYTDGTQETVNVHTKNLYNSATKIDGYYINDNGEIIENASYSYSALIPVGQNTQYCLSGMNNHNVATTKRLHAYDKDGNWLAQLVSVSAQPNTSFSVVGTTTSATAYVKLSIRNTDADIQLEQGSTATAYEPYYDGGTANTEMLLKVGNYKDEQSILDGIITKNVGIKVLDGTESLKEMGGTRSWGYCYYLDSQLQNAMSAINVNSYVTHFKAVSRCWDTATGPCFSFHQSGVSTWTGKPLFVVEQDTVEKFNQWLADQYNAGTPVIIVYPLATPTTESVSGQTLNTTSGDNVLEITQASIDGLEIEAKYKKTK